MDNHDWPTDQKEHLWSKWWIEKGPPNATEYRVCIHPNCRKVEHREIPKV